MLALDIKKPDLLEAKNVGVEAEPFVHIAAKHVICEVVEVVKSHAFRGGCAKPVIIAIGQFALTILVYKVDQAAADAVNRGHIQHFSGAVLGLCALGYRMVIRVRCIDHTPRH